MPAARWPAYDIINTPNRQGRWRVDMATICPCGHAVHAKAKNCSSKYVGQSYAFVRLRTKVRKHKGCRGKR